MIGETSKKEMGIQRKGLKLSLALVLLLQITLGAWAGSVDAAANSGQSSTAAVEPSRGQVSEAVATLQALLSQSSISDWIAFGLARSGQPADGRYLLQANKSVEDGSLRRVTDFARVALAVNAVGGDARAIGPSKSNLLAQLANFEKMTAQGVNAPAYALLAWDAAGYLGGAHDLWSRDALFKWLMDQRQADGGWSLVPGKSDVDITAIVLTALAPYQSQAGINDGIEGALAWLSSVQRDNAGFGNPTESSESLSQVLVALTSLGIDPVQDTRFVKKGKSPLARLLEFRLADGQFSHVPAGKGNEMANYNALLALTAVQRWMEGLPGLYSGVTTERSQVTVIGTEGQLVTGTAAGKTALEALLQVLKNADISYTVEQLPQIGAFLSSIAGIDNGVFGGYDGWHFAVKREGTWVTITEGMGSFPLQPADQLVVYYGDSGTTLIHSVQAEPAAPREGQSITLSVQKEELDWETGKLIVSPAEGATVKLGHQLAVTDQNGKALLKAMNSGTYELSVDGYVKGYTPRYVEWKSRLEVASYVKQVAVRVEGDAGMLAKGWAEGGTALEALEYLLRAQGVDYEIKDMSFGQYIHSISGVLSGQYGGYDGWNFAVIRGGDWLIPTEGAGTFLLEQGDEVVIYYSDAATKLVDPIQISKAVVTPGEEFTITVSNRIWNWELNQFESPTALAGATVNIGAISAMTDHKGQVKVNGLPEGLYSIEVTGYQEDGAPSVVRSVTSLPIAGAYSDESSIAPWAIEAVRTARAASLLRGMNDGMDTFKPKQAVTRAEFVAALVRAMGLKDSENKIFIDVPAQAWYAKEVEAAAAIGMVSGIGGGRFAPEAALTREQAAQLLMRALQLKSSATAELIDKQQINLKAVTAVQAVLQQGWMTAYEGKFLPKSELSREQAAIIAVRIWHTGTKKSL